MPQVAGWASRINSPAVGQVLHTGEVRVPAELLEVKLR
jgi:hypothetical protein